MAANMNSNGTLENQDAMQRFMDSSVDGKLVEIFKELMFMRKEQIDCGKGMLSVQKSVAQVSEKLVQVVNVTNQQSDFLKHIAYKSIDAEARSRRNNLIFRGLVENRDENCAYLIRDFLQNKLDLDPRDIYIARAHRLGKRIFGQQFSKRPIIVNFRDYGVVEEIMGRVAMLRGTPFSIDLDFPREISEARKRIWPKFKEIRTNDPRSKPKIVYPAKLIANGRVIHDEFPDWSAVMSKSRTIPFDQIKYRPAPGHMSAQLDSSQQKQTCNQDAQKSPMDMSCTLSMTGTRNSDNYTSISQCALTPGDDVIPPSQVSLFEGLNFETHVSGGEQNDSPTVIQNTDAVDTVKKSMPYSEPTVSNVQSSIFKSSAPVNVPLHRENTCIDTHITNTQVQGKNDSTRPDISVARASRSVSRSQRRSSSSKPYRRDSESHSRVAINRTPVSPQTINSGTNDAASTSGQAG